MNPNVLDIMKSGCRISSLSLISTRNDKYIRGGAGVQEMLTISEYVANLPDNKEDRISGPSLISTRNDKYIRGGAGVQKY